MVQDIHPPPGKSLVTGQCMLPQTHTVSDYDAPERSPRPSVKPMIYTRCILKDKAFLSRAHHIFCDILIDLVETLKLN